MKEKKVKKVNIVVLLALFLFSGLLAQGEEENKWVETENGSFKIERFWEETVGDYTCTYTIVRYKNTTNKTFKNQVEIEATVYDAKDKVVNMNTRSFFAYEYGPIKPGFEGTVKIPLECKKGQGKSVSVRISKAW